MRENAETFLRTLAEVNSLLQQEQLYELISTIGTDHLESEIFHEMDLAERMVKDVEPLGVIDSIRLKAELKKYEFTYIADSVEKRLEKKEDVIAFRDHLASLGPRFIDFYHTLGESVQHRNGESHGASAERWRTKVFKDRLQTCQTFTAAIDELEDMKEELKSSTFWPKLIPGYEDLFASN